MTVAVLAMTVGLTSAPTPVHAGDQSAEPTYVQVVASLQNDGFTIDKISRTFLGRIRIVASNSKVVREVVVSRNTGEIKSDMIIKVIGDGSARGTAGGTGRGSGGDGPADPSPGTGGGSIGGAVAGAGSAVGGAVGSVGGAVGGAVDSVGGAAGDAVDSVGGAVGGAIDNLGL
ncbi:hypothetical protein [Frigidibacter sp. ROC022]|uniref:hypothetical protein n=1 Tax=Frigidibacter sp. ROC022 TaxID=2971796 RepID=UPI00215AE0BD|nr:hypothetical protein [Frigidibacter sp. ROC022]MCR8723394.1 hypothetical protein [Frigidibacter sp. ROC022]